jgi:hypothetical protein
MKERELNRAKRLNGLNHLNSPVLPRREWSWAGKLVKKCDGLGFARPLSNRFLIFFRHAHLVRNAEWISGEQN